MKTSLYLLAFGLSSSRGMRDPAPPRSKAKGIELDLTEVGFLAADPFARAIFLRLADPSGYRPGYRASPAVEANSCRTVGYVGLLSYLLGAFDQYGSGGE